jgi:hypothetical protein
VGTNIFSGTTVAEGCEVVRCGGYDPGYGWRAAVQLCLDAYTNGITGVLLNDLDITNSVSDGLSVVGGTGKLANTTVAGVSIANYGLGASGRNALWARNDAVGNLTVTNSAIAEYKNDSATFTFHFTNIGSVAALAFSVQPGTAVAGAPFGQPPTLTTVDAFGSFTTSGLPAHLIASLALTNGPGALTGSTQCDLGTAAGNGSAAFTNLAISLAGTNDQLEATAPALAIGNALSLHFTVRPAPPAQTILGAPISDGPTVTLAYATTPGYSYHLVTTSNLAMPVWTPIPNSATNAQGSSATFTDPVPISGGQRYYRTISP